MNYKYYAKSNPIETIKEHTDKLLENLEILKRTYGAKIVQVIDMPEDRFECVLEMKKQSCMAATKTLSVTEKLYIPRKKGKIK